MLLRRFLSVLLPLPFFGGSNMCPRSFVSDCVRHRKCLGFDIESLPPEPEEFAFQKKPTVNIHNHIKASEAVPADGVSWSLLDRRALGCGGITRQTDCYQAPLRHPDLRRPWVEAMGKLPL